MKRTDIDSFLRENRPQVKDNPEFMLEVQQKMCAAEGIKSEVDRQRRHGRLAMILALGFGLVAGILTTSIAYLHPLDIQEMGDGLIATIRMAIDPWKQYLLLPTAGCAIALGLLRLRAAH